MLNIPEAIKTLFKTDGIQKNFRVHFPNAEYRDLTNADIVAGSVKFTESVCSKNVLQFGLAEASRIQFECVGVPSVYGAMIECFCEIDTSSLSSEYQTQMSDLDYPVYQIPYGRFEIRSCPRNADGMWKRRVEAYTTSIESYVYSDVLNAKLSHRFLIQRPYELFAQNAYLLLGGELNSDLGLNYTESTVSQQSGSALHRYEYGWTKVVNGSSVSCWIGTVSPSEYALGHFYPFTNESESLYRFTCDIDPAVYTLIETIVADAVAEQANEAEVRRFLYTLLLPGICYEWLNMQGDIGGDYSPIPLTNNPEDTGLCYPFGVFRSAVENSEVFNYYTLSKIGMQTDTYKTYDVGSYISNPVCKKYTMTNPEFQNAFIQIKPTAEINNTSTNFTTHVGSIDMRELHDGCMELLGAFEKMNRDGEYGYVHLSKSSPVTMLPDEYSSMWWDEYNVSPIGKVRLTYFDPTPNIAKEQTEDVTVGIGESMYDMTSNYVLKNLGTCPTMSDVPWDGYTPSEIVAQLLSDLFLPNIQDIAFTPVDLDALGLPYLEAGDYLEISAQDGTVVGTYILSRSLSGEQYLEDSIESQGGEIVGDTRSI